MDEMKNRRIIVTRKEELTPAHKSEHEPYEYYKYEILKKSSENRCCVSIYEIPPEKAAYPYHYHTANEEVFYILSGEGLLITPDGNRALKPGDVVVCPPNEKGAHKIRNTSKTHNLVYLDVDTFNLPDVVYYPDSDKVGIISGGQPEGFFKTNSAVDYYEGE